MKQSCYELKRTNSEYSLTTIELVDRVWVLHDVLRANDKWVLDGEASYVGEIIHDHILPIYFCPYCGEKLFDEIENAHTEIHEHHAPEPKYPDLSPDQFFQCPEIEQLDNSLQKAGIGNRWLVIQDPEGWWMLERFMVATEEMVANHDDVNDRNERHPLSGFSINFCPFCGELLDPKGDVSRSGGE